MKIAEPYLVTKESIPGQELPKIPEELKVKLKEAYSRYEHLIGIRFGDFEKEEIEKDRQQYRHLLFPDRDGYPVFCQRRCVKYMHLKSGIDYQYCAVQMYEEYIDYVAAGFVQGEAREDIEGEYYLTLSLIEEFSNINLKENKVYQLSKERIVA